MRLRSFRHIRLPAPLHLWPGFIHNYFFLPNSKKNSSAPASRSEQTNVVVLEDAKQLESINRTAANDTSE